MADEIELKLVVPPSDLAKIGRAKPLCKNQIGEKQEIDVVSVYYDTPSRVLRRKGVSFRLRRQTGKYLQTVKVDTGRLAHRKEWESEVPENKPDFKAVDETAPKPLLKKKIQK